VFVTGKASLLALAALAAAGCSGGLKRFAPPGIVKYEELAKDQPVNAAIAARIEQYRNQSAGGFPNLSEQPQKTPEGIAAPERSAMEAALIAERDALNDAIDADKELAAAEREASIEAARDALEEALARDDALARRERGLPLRDLEDKRDVEKESD
jgi:hypothetical protein